ncbi:rhomboid family intramembrane serine protease [Anaeromyxobacter sp. Fw109-5]|uniref:rhomboid family intramembrane serine protease n=1 Tax=Anaeromyxobacter sp. (strain Fw109-5) TaxID=404589 RepID=UPI0000ED811A|nr:rhomboid family intramembrane serine protease [Anaeromyxobacter sp. Fw109-5]ABS25209.1 Rhomboid family protein [Anaeromyxobacter sp. Fw109-5]
MIPLKDDTPLERTPVVTIAFIVVNVLAFLWQIDALALPAIAASGGDVVGHMSERLNASALRGGAIPYEILTLTDTWPRAFVPVPLTILTSMFLHGGLVHLGSNMLFLWIFGNNVEDALGRGRFVAFYFASGVVAALAQSVASAASGDVWVPMVGASGAIAGVLAAYMTLFPRARVLSALIIFIFVRLVAVPASFFIGLWFVLQLLSVVFGGSPGVAVIAHVFGFVAGWLLVRVMGRRSTWRARRVSW